MDIGMHITQILKGLASISGNGTAKSAFDHHVFIFWVDNNPREIERPNRDTKVIVLPDLLTDTQKADIADKRAKAHTALRMAGTVPTQVLEGIVEQELIQTTPGAAQAFEKWRAEGEPEDDEIDPALLEAPEQTPQ